MAGLGERASYQQRAMSTLLGATVLLGVLGLPVAVWLDLRILSERVLRMQASEASRIIDDMRSFYGSDVVGRVLQAPEPVLVTHNYRDIAGAIPIPSTLSIELGKRISAQDGSVKYRFVSDMPFKGREPHQLDDFEKEALARLKSLLNSLSSKFRVLSSTRMSDGRARRDGASLCELPQCASGQPEDGLEGRRRARNPGDLGQAADLREYFLIQIYFDLSIAGVTSRFCMHPPAAPAGEADPRHESGAVRGNDFLAGISMKLAKYLSPQIYKSIFSGQKDVAIATERKKLTIFFWISRTSPPSGTAAAGRSDPAVERILHRDVRHCPPAWGDLDKFVGDAILIFFGDPETKGVEEDARACLRMAVDMQQYMEQLNARWRKRGIDLPMQVRIGINTGFCNVGNFGSEDRMAYTIIGAEANIAARLQAIAEPGGICRAMKPTPSFATWCGLGPLEPILMKGIKREIVPYAVEGLLGRTCAKAPGHR